MRLAIVRGALAAMALSAMLAGCTSSGSPSVSSASSTVATAADKADLYSARALVEAELSYNTALKAISTAAVLGLITPDSPLALKIKVGKLAVDAAMAQARSAAAGEAQSTAVVRVLAAIADLRSATPVTPGS